MTTERSETDWGAVAEAGRVMDDAAMPDEQMIYVNPHFVITERPDAFVVYATPLDPSSWEPQI